MTALTESPSPQVMPEGMIFDHITGKLVKDNAKEQVRQRMARAIAQEYAISVADMAPDFPVPVDGKRKKVGKLTPCRDRDVVTEVQRVEVVSQPNCTSFHKTRSGRR